jgi:hypothetical protein
MNKTNVMLVFMVLVMTTTVYASTTKIYTTADDTFDEDTARTGTESWNVIDLVDGTGETTYLKFDISKNIFPTNKKITGVSLCQWVYNEGTTCGTNTGACAANEALRVEVWDNQTWDRADTLCPTTSCAAYLATIDDYHVMNHTGFTDASAPQKICFEHNNMTLALNRSITRGDNYITFVIRRIGGDSVDYYQNYGTDYINYTYLRPVLTVNYTGTSYDDITLNTSFQGANLINFTFINGNSTGRRLYSAAMRYNITGYNDGDSQYREYQFWYYAGLKNMASKQVTLIIENPQYFSGIPSQADIPTGRWRNMKPVYSIDNNILGTWTRMYYTPATTYANLTKRQYMIKINSSQNNVYFATFFPFPRTSVENYLRGINTTYPSIVNLTKEGTSELGNPLYILTLTNSSYKYSQKKKVFIIGGVHDQGEEQGIWESKGMIDWLLSSNTTAKAILKDYVIKIMMQINVDSSDAGRGRYAANSTTQLDINRMWTAARAHSVNVVQMVRNYVTTWQPQVFLDLHGMSSTPTNEFYYPGDADHVETQLINNISQYWLANASMTAQSTAGISSVEMDNLGAYSLTLESSYGSNRGKVINRTQYEADGIGFIRGVYGFLGLANAELIPLSPSITSTTLLSSTTPATNDSNLVCKVAYTDDNTNDYHNITISWLKNNVPVYSNKYTNHTNKAINDTLNGSIEDYSRRINPQKGYSVKDFAIFYDGARYHFYHIKGVPGLEWTTKGQQTNIAYQTSENLEQFAIQDDAIRISGNNYWDSGNIWAPNIFKNGSTYYMVYTGVNNWTIGHPEWNVQRIGLATSKNLKDWTRVSYDNCNNATGTGCIYDCDTFWSNWGSYGTDWNHGNCRDPDIEKIGNTFYMCYSTSVSIWNYKIGIVKSTDLHTWTDLGPVNVTMNSTAESCDLWNQNGYVTLFWTSNGGTNDRQIKYTYTNLSNFALNKGWNKATQAINDQYASEMINTTASLGYNIWGYMPNSGNYILMKRASILPSHTPNITSIPLTNLESLTSDGEEWSCTATVYDSTGFIASRTSSEVCIGTCQTYQNNGDDSSLLNFITKIVMAIVFILGIVLSAVKMVNDQEFSFEALVPLIVGIICLGVLISL